MIHVGMMEAYVTHLGLFILLIIAGIAGALGLSNAGYSLGGCLVSIAVGFIGAFIGSWLSGALGLPDPFVINIQGKPFPILWSIIGAFLFTMAGGLISRILSLNA